jgi:hypothetical protein
VQSTYVDQLLSHVLIVVEGVKQLRAGMALLAQSVLGLSLLTLIHLTKLQYMMPRGKGRGQWTANAKTGEERRRTEMLPLQYARAS